MASDESMSDSQKLFHFGALAVFGICAVVGIVMLAFFRGTPPEGQVSGPTVIWGPPFGGKMDQFMIELKRRDDTFEKTSYVAKHPATMYGDLLEALAVGQGPDLVIVDPSILLPLLGKVRAVPYTVLSQSEYRAQYVEGAEVFALDDGVYAYPMFVDPLVLYWNRTLFTNALVAEVPQDWDTFVATVPKLTQFEAGTGSKVQQSGVAFGEYDNVLHAKEILSSLLFQSGIEIVHQEAGVYRSDLSGSEAVKSVGQPDLALRFYTNFSNPKKLVYSWNKTFERSREAFAANKVAMYGGFVSERDTILEINPNLNYDIAPWPQSATGKNVSTYGRFYGMSILQSSKYPADAQKVLTGLTQPQYTELWEEYTGLPTVRRAYLAEEPEDPHSKTIVRSALISKDWLQPDRSAVDELFQRMINGVVAGRMQSQGALNDGRQDLEAMLNRYN